MVDSRLGYVAENPSARPSALIECALVERRRHHAHLAKKTSDGFAAQKAQLASNFRFDDHRCISWVVGVRVRRSSALSIVSPNCPASASLVFP